MNSSQCRNEFLNRWQMRYDEAMRFWSRPVILGIDKRRIKWENV